MWGGNSVYGVNNVVAQIQDSGYSKTHQRQLWADARLDQDFSFWVKGLSMSFAGGYDNASINYENRSQSHQYGREYYTDKNLIGTPGGSPVATETLGDKQSKPSFGYGVSSQWRIGNLSVGAHYKTSFRGDDNFSASAIYNIKGEIRDGLHNTVYRANVMGAFHYDLQNRYVVDLVLAANGSSRSYPATWAFSPTLSLGYIFADDADEFLSYGKVRASVGIQHTDYVPAAGLWLARWDASNGGFIYGEGYNHGGGAFLSAFPTSSFSQEQTAGINLGADLRLWNALDITADVFYQRRSHILLSAAMENSYVVGIQSSYNDVGEVDSYGVELGAKFAKKVGRDFWVNGSAMMTWGSNQIRHIIGEPPYPGIKWIGDRVTEAYGLEAIGFFADQADIAASPLQEFSQVKPGDIKYKDQNGDGKINMNDYVSLGKSSYMPELNYAFSVGAEWKGIGLNAVFQGVGNYMANLRGVTGVWNVLNNSNLSVEYFNKSWDVMDDKSKAKYPRFSSDNVTNNTQQSTVWMKDIYYLKLRTCELYYKLPARIVERLNLGGIKVFVQGQNLWGMDNVKAMDAEVLSTAYPVLKSVNLGASVMF
jgi:hypothetical protein